MNSMVEYARHQQRQHNIATVRMVLKNFGIEGLSDDEIKDFINGSEIQHNGFVYTMPDMKDLEEL